MSANRGTLVVGKGDLLKSPAAQLFLSFGEWASGKEGGFSKQRFGLEDAKIVRDSFQDQKLVRARGAQKVPIYPGFPSIPNTRGENPAASAVGWVDDFVIEDKGARLPIRWGALGAQILRDETFRFFAPLWAMKSVSGVFRPFKLVAVGLLNDARLLAEINTTANDNRSLSTSERTAAMQRAMAIEMSKLDPRLSPQDKHEIAWRRAVKTYYPDFL